MHISPQHEEGNGGGHLGAGGGQQQQQQQKQPGGSGSSSITGDRGCYHQEGVAPGGYGRGCPSPFAAVAHDVEEKGPIFLSLLSFHLLKSCCILFISVSFYWQ